MRFKAIGWVRLIRVGLGLPNLGYCLGNGTYARIVMYNKLTNRINRALKSTRNSSEAKSMGVFGVKQQKLHEFHCFSEAAFMRASIYQCFSPSIVSSPDPPHHAPSENWRGKNGRRVW